MSLQLGGELFDIQSHAEPSASTSSAPNAEAAASAIGAELPSSQPSQNANGKGPKPRRLPSDTAEPDVNGTSLTYLVTPHEASGLLTVELPIAGSLSFKPSDMNSETHRKLAQAVKHHRVAKVTAEDNFVKIDPELEAEERDKKLREQDRKKAKERKKLEEKADDEAFAMARRRGGRQARADSFSGDERPGGKGLAPRRRGGAGAGADDYEEDDFVVGTPEGQADGSGSDEEEEGDSANDSPDEMERAEARIEAREKARKEGKASPTGSGSDMDVDDDEPAEATDNGDSGEGAARVNVRKQVVESDEE